MKKVIIFLVSILLCAESWSQDRSFARTYQSFVLPQGEKELEIWTNYSFGREAYYSKLKNRFEFEIGLSSKLQTSFYVNTSQQTYLNEGYIVKEPVSVSFSNEWKYKLSDPVADKIGAALYAEFEIGTDEYAGEFKLILDKKIGKHLFAFNAVGELEYEIEDVDGNEVEFESEPILEFDAGYLYYLNSHWGLGAELRNENKFSEGELEHSPVFLGPTVSYSIDKFWIIFNCQPQVTNLHKNEGEGNLQLTDYEKMDLRLIFSFAF